MLQRSGKRTLVQSCKMLIPILPLLSEESLRGRTPCEKIPLKKRLHFFVGCKMAGSLSEIAQSIVFIHSDALIADKSLTYRESYRDFILSSSR